MDLSDEVLAQLTKLLDQLYATANSLDGLLELLMDLKQLIHQDTKE